MCALEKGFLKAANAFPFFFFFPFFHAHVLALPLFLSPPPYLCVERSEHSKNFLKRIVLPVPYVKPTRKHMRMRLLGETCILNWGETAKE